MTTTMVRRRAKAGTLGAVAALLLSACTGSATETTGSASSSSTPSASSSAYTTLSEATLEAGDPVPAPTEEVVLRVTGTDRARPVEFDMPTLEQLGLVEYSVDDRQAEGRRATFQGVLLSSLLDVVGAEGATVLRTVALNDYGVDIPVSDVEDYPVLLATRVDGERMSVERYGPTRVIYPTDAYDLDPTVYDPRWIWQLASIVVE